VTLARYLLGVTFSVIALAPLAVGAVTVRRRVLADWTGAPARLAESILALALLVGVAQALGAVGIFERLPVAFGCASAGTATWLIGRRVRPRSSGARALLAAPRLGGFELGAAITGLALILAQWGYFTIEALRRGMLSSDTLGYHGPVAARFVQDGSILGLQFNGTNSVQQFLPYNSELLHALGILFFARDTLSPFVNLGALGLALLAAWCIGHGYRAAPAALLGVGVVTCLPALIRTQPGQAYNDIVVLALVLSAAALLTVGGARPAPVLFAGLAAGLALGTKLSAFPPVAVLTVVVPLLAPRGVRGKVAGLWLLCLVAMGGLWYARNLAHVGNPLPGFQGLGPLRLPSLDLPHTPSIASYLTDTSAWRDNILPGFQSAFGSGWLLVVALALGGMTMSVVQGRTPLLRMLGLAAIVSVLAYAFIPSTGYLTSLPGFGGTLRYVTPGLAMGMALLPVVPALARSARGWGLVLLGGLLVWTLSEAGLALSDRRRAAIALVVGGLIAAGVLVKRRGAPSLGRPTLYAVAAMLTVGVVLAGWQVQDRYMRSRYKDGPLAWANDVRHTRIAVAYSLDLYPLYGRDLSNTVRYLGHQGPHGAYLPIRRCSEWREALNRGRYRYVVIASLDVLRTSVDPNLRAMEWTRSDPAAIPLLRSGTAGLAVFRLDGRRSPARC